MTRNRVDDLVASSATVCAFCKAMAEETAFLRAEIERAINQMHNGKHRTAVAILHGTRKNRDYSIR